jgi:hypothetical protein
MMARAAACSAAYGLGAAGAMGAARMTPPGGPAMMPMAFMVGGPGGPPMPGRCCCIIICNHEHGAPESYPSVLLAWTYTWTPRQGRRRRLPNPSRMDIHVDAETRQEEASP